MQFAIFRRFVANSKAPERPDNAAGAKRVAIYYTGVAALAPAIPIRTMPILSGSPVQA